MRKRTRKGRAFTLVEVVIASLIAAVLFTILWFVFSTGGRTFQRGCDYSEAMASVLLVCDRLEADVKQLNAPEGDEAAPFSISRQGRSVAFHVAAIDSMEEGGLGRRKLTYEHRGLQLRRNGRIVRQVFIKELAFRFFAMGKDEGADEDMQFLRLEGVATDHFGRASFPFTRLLALPLSSARAKRAGRR